MITTAIMQPTYLPWYGYFSLINLVDNFVFLDNVQFEKRSWQQRNYLKSSNGKIVITVPVKTKNSYHQLIKDVQIDRTSNFANKHKKTIDLLYKKSKFYKLFYNDIFDIIEYEHLYLANLNVALIRTISEFLNLKKKNFFLASEICDEKENKDLLLSSICKKLNTDIYISPLTSKIYLNNSESFINKNIKIKYFNFNSVKYSQLFGEFLEKMSIVDLLFNTGPAAKDILDKNYILTD